MKKIALAIILALPIVSGIASAQENLDLVEARQRLARDWQRLNTKVLDMAREFPDELLDYRPHPDSRSFMQEVRHVASGVKRVALMMKGERPGPMNFLGEMSREEVVQFFEQALEESTVLLEKKFNPQVISVLEHMAEHYGKLVGHYRNNNLVPPHTRKQQEERRKREQDNKD